MPLEEIEKRASVYTKFDLKNAQYEDTSMIIYKLLNEKKTVNDFFKE
jgi:hypothetical protein